MSQHHDAWALIWEHWSEGDSNVLELESLEVSSLKQLVPGLE